MGLYFYCCTNLHDDVPVFAEAWEISVKYLLTWREKWVNMDIDGKKW